MAVAEADEFEVGSIFKSGSKKQVGNQNLLHSVIILFTRGSCAFISLSTFFLPFVFPFFAFFLSFFIFTPFSPSFFLIIFLIFLSQTFIHTF